MNSSILQTPACDQDCDHNSHGGVLLLLMMIVVMIPMIVVMISMIVVIIVMIVVIIVIKSNDNSYFITICSGLAAVWQNKRTGLFQFLGEHNGRPVFVVIAFLDFPTTNRHIFCCITFAFLPTFNLVSIFTHQPTILGHFHFSSLLPNNTKVATF